MRGTARRIIPTVGQRLRFEDYALEGRCTRVALRPIDFLGGVRRIDELRSYNRGTAGCRTVLWGGTWGDNRPTEFRVPCRGTRNSVRSEEHTSELQSRLHLLSRLLL